MALSARGKSATCANGSHLSWQTTESSTAAASARPKAQTDHVEAAAGSKGKNSSEAESGAGEAAAEPSTTKTYGHSESLRSREGAGARSGKKLAPRKQRQNLLIPKPTSLLVIRDSSTFLGIDRLRSGLCKVPV
jgi:hypothetical protein